MLGKLLVCALVASASAKTVSITWKDCASTSSVGHITAVTIAPNPPQLGSQTNFTGTGTLNSDVSDGQTTITATFSGLPIPVNPATVSVCGSSTVKLPLNLGSIVVQGLDCPATKGPVTISELITVPTIAPLGTYTAQLTSVNQDGDELFCVDTTILIKA
jgi:hypothetical protein